MVYLKEYEFRCFVKMVLSFFFCLNIVKKDKVVDERLIGVGLFKDKIIFLYIKERVEIQNVKWGLKVRILKIYRDS